jgi:hypothetical protein
MVIPSAVAIRMSRIGEPAIELLHGLERLRDDAMTAAHLAPKGSEQKRIVADDQATGSHILFRPIQVFNVRALSASMNTISTGPSICASDCSASPQRMSILSPTDKAIENSHLRQVALVSTEIYSIRCQSPFSTVCCSLARGEPHSSMPAPSRERAALTLG